MERIKLNISKIHKAGGIRSCFAESIEGVWLLRGWVSVVGYVLLFLIVLVVVFWMDGSAHTRHFIHPANANEIVIGVFTILLTLLIPLSTLLLQDKRSGLIDRQAILRSTVRLKGIAFITSLVCMFLFIPSGLHHIGGATLPGDSITIRSIFIPVLFCCVTFIVAGFYRSIRWLQDEPIYDPDKEDAIVSSNFTSYRFSHIVKLLGAAESKLWVATWSQQFAINHEIAVHESFFRRLNNILDNKKMKDYSVLHIELRTYNDHFKKRNSVIPGFEHRVPEKFFSLLGRIEEIKASNNSSDDRTEGLYSSIGTLKVIARKIIDSMMDSYRVHYLFDAINKYVKRFVSVQGGNKADNFLLETFLMTVFNAVREEKITVHGAVEDYFSRMHSGVDWRVTYDNLQDKGGENTKNIGSLIASIYRRWLEDLLNKRSDDEIFSFNDRIVGYAFPEVDTITMGQLYWLLWISQSDPTCYRRWMTTLRPIGLVSFPVKMESVEGRSNKEFMRDFWDDRRKRRDESFRLFCYLYNEYLRAIEDYLDQGLNMAEVELKRLEKIENTKDFNDSERCRLEDVKDFITIVGMVKFFLRESES